LLNKLTKVIKNKIYRNESTNDYLRYRNGLTFKNRTLAKLKVKITNWKSTLNLK